MTTWLKAGNTAVITGGASGIGLAAAQHYAQQGMNVVIADLDDKVLQAAARTIHPQHNASVQTFVVDVTESEQLDALRNFALKEFGHVHCLMNNAGASIRQSKPWENLDKFKQQIDINFWGVVHGCHAFLPSMLKNRTSSVVINTGSKQGITKPPGNYAYNLSKSGVIGYTESVAYALRDIEDCCVSAHLLIPGFTYTGMIAKFLPEKPEGAWTSEQVIEFMINALSQQHFYILCPDNETPRALDERRIQWNVDDIIHNRPALSRWHPEFAKHYDEFINKN